MECHHRQGNSALKILLLTQILPFPPDAGPKVKTWHVLRYFKKSGHEVTLASFVRPEEVPHLDKVREHCSEVHAVPIHRSRIKDIYYLILSNFTNRPFLVERDDLNEMRRLIHDLVARIDFDIIHADQLTMAQFAFPGADVTQRFPGKSARLVFDAHNAVWTIVKRSRENAAWYLKPVLGLEARRVQRYEAALVQNFDHTLAVTSQDKQALLEALPPAEKNGASSHISVIPIAVDTVMMPPVAREPGSKRIVTLGTLHYPPNADGIRWFAREVFPLIQTAQVDARLTIIGKNPPADFIEMAANSAGAIDVTGYVPDLTPYLEQACLMVVPVRAGGGMRVRILEAFSRAMPVVTTTVGLEGINAVIGQDVLVEDTPARFADTVVAVLNDPQLQNRLALRGRQLAENQYDWQVVLKEMNAIFQPAAG
jgi:polysaccharide biosynthesis protein PslH